MARVETPSGLTYKEAGVDTAAGDELVERIKPLAASTRIHEIIGGVGGFAGLCRVPADVDDPVLVSGTDGVGTKLKVAFAVGRHDTIGIDLVGMCVNDILTCGARPLFFLDYFATGKLDVAIAERVIAGIARGCKESGCALLGGETAEHPGMHAPGEYDLAGFAVGVVAKKKIIDGSRVLEGDAAIALPSSGLHSNGYSLARRVLFDVMQLPLDACPAVLEGQTVADALLTPTRLYARAVSVALASGIDVRAMIHVTGSGIPGNVPRVLPEGLGLRMTHRWKQPRIFDLIAKGGNVAEAEMRATFNLGIGYILVVRGDDLVRTLDALANEGAFDFGRIVRVPPERGFEERVEWPA